MASSPAERVLSCPNLPSLPAVAMKVLELTRDPNMSMQSIAQTVQNDPALCAKVLKTVNSSYYGLTVPCPSIPRAMSLLGLNTVKSIVLGFSLVDTTRRTAAGQSFDLSGYWRRSIQTAVAARWIMTQTRRGDPEEAFVGAMMTDIGMLACLAALREEYLKVAAGFDRDHDGLAAAERDAFGFDHCTIGKQIAERWKLPAQLVSCIGFHHHAERSPAAHRALTEAVAAGGLVAALLKSPVRPASLQELCERCETAFGLSAAQCKELLTQTADGAGELAELLEVNIGDHPDLAAIMSDAHEQLIANQESIAAENAELSRRTVTDALTGAYNRAYYDRELPARLQEAKERGQAVGVLFIDADKFKAVNDTHGHQAGDAVLKELAQRLRDAVGSVATVCRYGGEEFGVIVPGADLERAIKVGELLRRVVCSAAFDLTRYGVPISSIPITISVGVSAFSASRGGPTTAEELTHAADEGVYAAKQSGRNCVRTAGGAVKQGPSATIMVVDDDPLAVRLIEVLLGRSREIRTVSARSGDEAMAILTDPARAGARPDAILSDVNMPGMTGTQLAEAVRRLGGASRIPIVLMTAGSLAQTHAGEDGADAVVDKAELTTSTEQWIDRIMKMVASARAGVRAAA